MNRIIACIGLAWLFLSCQEGSLGGGTALNMLTYGSSSSKEGQIMQYIIREFGNQYPGVSLQVQALEGEEYHRQLAAKIEADNLPDVAYIWQSVRSAPLFESDHAVDLRTYMTFERYNPKIVRPISPFIGIPEGIYALPISLGISSVFYVNRQILQDVGLEVPQSLDDLLDMLPALQQTYPKVMAMGNKSPWVMNSTLLGVLVARVTGESNWFQQAAKGRRRFTSEGFVHSLELLQNLYSSGLLAPDTLFDSYQQALDTFVSGQIPFMIDGDWRLGEIAKDKAFLQTLELYPFPSFSPSFSPSFIPNFTANQENPELQNSVSGGPSPGYGLTKAALRDTQTTNQALAFVQFTLSDYAVREWAEVASYLPTVKEASAFAKNSAQLQKKQALLERASVFVDIPDQVLPQNLNQVLNQGLQELAFAKTTPRQLAAELEAVRQGKL